MVTLEEQLAPGLLDFARVVLSMSQISRGKCNVGWIWFDRWIDDKVSSYNQPLKSNRASLPLGRNGYFKIPISDSVPLLLLSTKLVADEAQQHRQSINRGYCRHNNN